MDFSGGDYRWWVAGWNGDGYGAWTTGTDFTIPQMKPDAPALVSPTGGVDVADGTVEYQWQHDARATWYQLWSGCPTESKTQWFSAAATVSGGVARASMTHARWGDYSWYVRGLGPDGAGVWSSGGDFSRGRPKPFDQSATKLQWDDSRTWEAGWYQIWINDVTGGGRVKEDAWWFNRSAVSTENLDIVSTPTRATLTTGDYEWTIRAWSSVYGQGPWSDTQAFSVP